MKNDSRYLELKFSSHFYARPYRESLRNDQRKKSDSELLNSNSEIRVTTYGLFLYDIRRKLLKI